MPYYANPNIEGIKSADSNADGYSINLSWATAYPSTRTNKIAYNIYMAVGEPAFPSDFFNNPPSFVAFGSTSTTIMDLHPGQMYFFAVRALEYNPSNFNSTLLPTVFSGLQVYPQSLLRNDVSETDSIISLIDTEGFPNTGVIKVGVELINYSVNDTVGNNLILTNAGLQRGFNNTKISIHNEDGYDGYVFRNPIVIFYPVGIEEQNTVVFQCQNRFDVNHYSFTITDGYRQKINNFLYNTDLDVSDSTVEQLPSYIYSGWHRDDPVALLAGDCVGSYLGGRMGCADGYSGVGMLLSGISLQTQANQREEILLSLTGEPVNLFRRQMSGIVCYCVIPSNEQADYRCVNCFGTGFVTGYKQYFNPLRSDGKILVRFDPTVDTILDTEAGIESQFLPTAWSLINPSLKSKDFIVRYDQTGLTPEFRYEVLNVTRNKLLASLSGVQKFALQRIRKTSPLYQVSTFNDTSLYPYDIQTSISSSLGIPAHSHTIRMSEKITDVSQISQITDISAGHSHVVRDGNVEIEVGHSHIVIF